MTIYEKWRNEYFVNCGLRRTTSQDMAGAFAGGMLAAADISEDSASHKMADIINAQNIADMIREAATEK